MRLLSQAQADTLVVEESQIKDIILTSGKAPDREGLAAEHLKLLPETAISSLTAIINRILSERKIPPILKKSYKLPITKKGKDKHFMDHHRGITITAILCQVLESGGGHDHQQRDQWPPSGLYILHEPSNGFPSRDRGGCRDKTLKQICLSQPSTLVKLLM